VRRRLVIRPLAQIEALEAFAWYQRRRPGLGLDFRDRLGDTLDRVLAQPFACAIRHRNLRQAFVERFPYFVFYAVVDDAVVVVGVIHGSRRPATWKRRA